MRKGLLSLAGIGVAALMLTGCDEWGDWGPSDRYKEDFEYTHDLKPGGRLSLETMNGSVEVAGWDQDRVEITGTKYAASEQMMRAMKIDVVASGDSVRIRTIPPSGYRGGMGARYVIRVPRRTDLERITSSNGRIELSEIEGSARLQTSNGSVKAINVNGALELTTSNGSVDLSEHTGPAIVRTSNGQIRADNVRGQLEAVTSNASIHARLGDPEAGRLVRLQSSNGSITLEMDELRSNEVRMSTSNSSVTLKLPAQTAANLRARTSNASITTDFDVNVKGTISKNHVEGAIGGGGPLLDISTSNGSIRVLRL